MDEPDDGRSRHRQRRRGPGEAPPVETSVRLGADLHQALLELAVRRHMSLNRVINELLEAALRDTAT